MGDDDPGNPYKTNTTPKNVALEIRRQAFKDGRGQQHSHDHAAQKRCNPDPLLQNEEEKQRQHRKR
jgi:hypothetical protein